MLSTASRAAQRAWLLQAMRDTWTGFVAQFRALWNGAVQAGEGELSAAALYGPAAVNGPAALKVWTVRSSSIVHE